MTSSSISSIFWGLALTCATTQAAVFTNGSFETGNFTGWITSDLSNPYDALQVQASGATDGIYAATSGFDGNGPGTISMAQDIGTLAAGSHLTFDYHANVDDFGGVGDRVFSVSLQPSGGGTPVQTFEVFRALSGQSTSSGNTSADLDLSPYAGQNVRVSFELFVPGDYNGPGGFAIDNVNISAVPEPAAYGLFAGMGLVGLAAWRRGGFKTRA